MGAWIVNVLLAAAAGAANSPGVSPNPSQAEPLAAVALDVAGATAARPPRQKEPALEASVRHALRRWGRVTDDKAHLAAGELLNLYGKLRSDNSLPQTTRNELEMKVRWRLARLAEQIAHHHARQARSATHQRAGPKGLASGGDHRANDRPGGLGQAAPGAWGQGNRQLGGPAAAMPPGGNFAAPDYGPDLVDLIQRTIAPNSWDIRGGPGSIYYWRPGRALVVRQTTAVHEAVADGLQQLRGGDP